MSTDLKALVLIELLNRISLPNLLKYRLLMELETKVYRYTFDCHEVRLYNKESVAVWSDNFDERFDFTWEEIDCSINMQKTTLK